MFDIYFTPHIECEEAPTKALEQKRPLATRHVFVLVALLRKDVVEKMQSETDHNDMVTLVPMDAKLCCANSSYLTLTLAPVVPGLPSRTGKPKLHLGFVLHQDFQTAFIANCRSVLWNYNSEINTLLYLL